MILNINLLRKMNTAKPKIMCQLSYFKMEIRYCKSYSLGIMVGV